MAAVMLAGIPAGLEPALRRALEPRAGPDVVVAGFGDLAVGPFLETTQAGWEEAVAGVREAFVTAQSLAASLVERGAPGRVILLSSPPAVRPVHGAVLQATAGAFLTTLAQVAAAELAPTGITVNVVVPGWLEGSPEALVDGVPAGRLARPEEIAEVCRFLASPEAAYVTGAVVVADGGFSLTKSPGGSPLLGSP